MRFDWEHTTRRSAAKRSTRATPRHKARRQNHANQTQSATNPKRNENQKHKETNNRNAQKTETQNFASVIAAVANVASPSKANANVGSFRARSLHEQRARLQQVVFQHGSSCTHSQDVPDGLCSDVRQSPTQPSERQQ